MEGSSLRELQDKYGISNVYQIRKIIPKWVKTVREFLKDEGTLYCVKCKSYKKNNYFHKNKRKTRSVCKTCRSESEPYRKEYLDIYRNIPENKLRKSEMDKRYRCENKEYIKKRRSSEKYKAIKKLYDKKYYNKTQKIPELRLSRQVKCAMSASIKYKKKNQYFKILGYTPEDLIKHLESKFEDGMTWANYGLRGWHIDHIRPLVTFNMSLEEEFIQAWSLSNLQPLWGSLNCSKGSLYEGIRHKKSTKK